MHLLRAGTVSVCDLERSVRNYSDWLDYTVLETGQLNAELAGSWGTPATAGAAFAVLGPASGTDIFLRLVEAPPVPDFVPLKTYGWAALEFCVTDVLATYERMRSSPFEVIGPPRKIPGLDAIHPMQALGPDGEVCYFTQINSDLPEFRLPRARSSVDHLFINVLAASDMTATQSWLVDGLGLSLGREHMEIEYTMLAKAFGKPLDTRYVISTITHERDVFLEVDQMPPEATPRPRHQGLLPPGISITTVKVPELEAIRVPGIAPANKHEGVIYAGHESRTFVDPDGTLFELVEIPTEAGDGR